METVSKKDAMQFPLIGSAVLFGLYIVVKLVSKEYLDILISVYFAAIGARPRSHSPRPAHRHLLRAKEAEPAEPAVAK